jgi:hypothetical protein
MKVVQSITALNASQQSTVNKITVKIDKRRVLPKTIENYNTVHTTIIISAYGDFKINTNT